MHIPDAYLSPATEAAAFGVMIPLWTVAARRTARELSTKQTPLLSIGAAFCFAIQMFNIPAIGGTTAHALGSTLLAILVGPWAALLGLTLSLTIQALLFGDGGILSLGANCWDMGFVACFVGYGIYRLGAGQSENGSSRRIVAAGIAAFLGTVAASFSAGVLLGIQPIIAHDAAGHALYCPFGLNISVPAMVMSHLLAAGPADAFVTVAALAYLWKSFPELVIASARPRVGTTGRIAGKLGWILVLTPIGLIAAGDAWGEWSLDELKERVGYAPAGIAHSHQLVHPLLPDYGFAGIQGKPWEVAGYLVSAFVGCCLVAGFTRTILRGNKVRQVEAHSTSEQFERMPGWLSKANPRLPAASPAKSPWFENTLLKLKSTVEKTVAAEAIAHSDGFLQSVHPVAKSIGFLPLLVAVGLSRTPLSLLALLGVALVLAYISNIPLRPMLVRVAEAVAFFGLVVALPVALQSVTSGPLAFKVAGISVSTSGLHLSAMILLRLAAGISLAMVWNLTTKWYELLRSLRSLGVPNTFLTTATLTYRYMFVVVETLGEMVQARTARQVGACDKRQARTYAGSGSAILFSKSLAFTEEMHHAMRSRSFERVQKISARRSWKRADSAVVLVGALSLLAVSLQGIFHAF